MLAIDRLPGDSTLRFGIVGAGVAAVVLAVAENLWYVGLPARAQQVVIRCADEGLASSLCRDGQHQRVIWTLSVAVLVLAIGVLITLVAAWFRRRGLVAAPPQVLNGPAVIVPVFGDSVPPILWRPSRPVATARADGLGTGYVEVGPSFMSAAVTHPARARAVLLHEAHHLRSRDVLPTRLTLWVPVTAVALVFLNAAAAIAVGGSTLGPALTRSVVVVLVIHLSRAGVLRARETAADWAAMDIEPVALRLWLNHAATEFGRWRRLRDRLVAPHPSPGLRLQAVDVPETTCRLRLDDAMLIGLTGATAGGVLSRLWRDWFGYGKPAFWAELVGWGAVGGLLGCWLVALCLRAVAAAKVIGLALPTIGVLRFALVLGTFLVTGNLLFGNPAALTFDFPAFRPIWFLTAGLAILATVGLARWFAWAAAWWYELALDPRAKRLPGWLANTLAFLIGAGVLGLSGSAMTRATLETTFAPDAAVQVNSSTGSIYQQVVLIVSSGPGLVLVTSAAVLPLAWLWRRPRRRTGLPAWLVPPVTEPVTGAGLGLIVTGLRSSWRVPVCGGLLAGVAGAVAILAVRGVTPPPTDWFDVQLAGALPELAGAAAIVVIVLVAVCGSVAPPLLGGVAAGIGSVVAVVGLSDPFSWYPSIRLAFGVQVVTNVGAPAVAAAVLVTAWVPGRGAPRARRIGGSTALVALTLAITAGCWWQLIQPPSLENDLSYMGSVWSRSLPEVVSVATACTDRPTPAAVLLADTVYADLAQPVDQPHSGVVRAAAAAYMDIVSSCRDGLAEAVAAGADHVRDVYLQAVNNSLQRWKVLVVGLHSRL